MAKEAKWYVVHTYSGYENKVKTNIEKAIENRNMQDIILDVRVPTEEVVEVKDNKKKVVQRKLFPGYVVIKMVMTDESWYVVRNTRGVTGFVGPGSKPEPITQSEVDAMGFENTTVSVEFAVGDSVRIDEGPLEGFVGTVEEVNMEKRKVRVLVAMFGGRETPVEMEFNQVEPLV